MAKKWQMRFIISYHFLIREISENPDFPRKIAKYIFCWHFSGAYCRICNYKKTLVFSLGYAIFAKVAKKSGKKNFLKNL